MVDDASEVEYKVEARFALVYRILINNYHAGFVFWICKELQMEPFTQQPSSLPNQPESGHYGQVHTTQRMIQQTPVQQAKTFISTNIKKPWGIAVAIVVGLLVLGIIIDISSMIFAQGQSSPTATLQQYCDGEVHQNASEVFSTMDSPGQTEAAIQEHFSSMQSTG